MNMLNTFVNWYGKLQGQVRWSNCLSSIFNIKGGVCEGGIASPILFNFYINKLIAALRSSGMVCYLGSDYVAYILFADNILLLSASVCSLQRMVNLFYKYGKE